MTLDGSFLNLRALFAPCAEDGCKYLAWSENKQACHFQVPLLKFKDCYSNVTHAIETLQAAETRETCMLIIKSSLNNLCLSLYSFEQKPCYGLSMKRFPCAAHVLKAWSPACGVILKAMEPLGGRWALGESIWRFYSCDLCTPICAKPTPFAPVPQGHHGSYDPSCHRGLNSLGNQEPQETFPL